ncbi:MAG TPA: aminoglycoside phosphotransferase family protein [Acidimicrobiales bacterium]
MATIPMPSLLVEACGRDGRDAWLQGLPAEIVAVAERWDLTLGEPFEPGGQTAWVAPARSSHLGEVVLKVGWWHMEAEDEAAGLREWAGDGAIRIFAEARSTQTTTALLLERCTPGTTLAERPEEEQDIVIAGLLRRLWRQPEGATSFRSLQSMCDYWADCFERKLADGAGRVDPALARHGADLFRALPATATTERLLCTDLHAGNVLMAQREPWLVIDPKPFVGDPTYDALQHLFNCHDRLSADPRGLVARFAGLLGLDADRLLLWLFARCVVESPDLPWALDVARQIPPSDA